MFQTVNYTIGSKHLPMEFSGFRIVHLSDLHGAVYGERNEKLIQEIRKVRPDLIAMTGDMADDSKNGLPGLLQLCGMLAGEYPMYFCVGNHEQMLKEEVREGLLGQLREMGVCVLDNQWRTISRKGACIRIYGLTLPITYYKDLRREYQRGVHFTTEDVRGCLGEAAAGSFCLLLAHNPLYYPSYRGWGADLVLSGHIHGGIIHIPGLGGLLSPDLTFFPKYDAGHFMEDGRHLVVSRGLGNHFFVRVLNPPEVVAITLEPPGADHAAQQPFACLPRSV